jgi:alpha-mannosidase
MIDDVRASGVFKYITENPSKGMTAWKLGRTLSGCALNRVERVYVDEIVTGGVLQYVKYSIPFKNSKLSVTVELAEGSSTLVFNAEVDWHEIGNKERGIPALSFFVALPEEASEMYKYDIPFGTIERAAFNNDLPGNRFISAQAGSGKALMLTTDSKYGYRGYDNALSVNLIRSSFDPDPYPEYGVHNMRIGLAVCNVGEEIETAARFAHPLWFCANTRHEGNLPSSGSFLSVEGHVKISCVKPAEDGVGCVIRMYNTGDGPQRVSLTFAGEVLSAGLVDLTERDIQGEVTWEGKNVTLAVPARAVTSVRVSFS